MARHIHPCAIFPNESSLTKPTLNHQKRKFTAEEDERLAEIVGRRGDANWAQIAQELGTRNCRQCRERWKNYLCPDIRKDPFTPVEDSLILSKYRELGSQWSAIAPFFPGRTDVNIKNRWVVLTGGNSPEKRVRRKSQVRDNSPLWNPFSLDESIWSCEFSSFLEF
jgi:hypothetical protein